MILLRPHPHSRRRIVHIHTVLERLKLCSRTLVRWPDSMSRLATHEYWEERYQQDPEPFDWLQRYSTCREFREALKKQLRATDTTLVVGAGSSRLPEELFADGHTKLTAIDWSSTCVSQLKERYARSQNLKIETAVMDARSLQRRLVRRVRRQGFARRCALRRRRRGARERTEAARRNRARVQGVGVGISPRLDRAARRPIAATEATRIQLEGDVAPIAKPTSSLTAAAIAPRRSRRRRRTFCTCARAAAAAAEL